MKKHLKYYYALVKIQIMNFTQYRTEFFSIIAGTFAYTIVSILFINILYKNIKEIGGYNYYEVVFLFTTVQAIFYLWASFFGSTYKDIVKNIIAGSLDFYLLKPINLAFNLLTFRFDLIKLLPSILFVVYLYVYSLRSINIDYSFINLAMYLVTLLLSLFIITCYYFSVGLLSVFYGDTNELKNNVAKLNDFSKYPLNIYTKGKEWIFFTFLPLITTAFVPSYILLRGFSLYYFLMHCLSVLIVFLITRFIFNKAVKGYCSAS